MSNLTDFLPGAMRNATPEEAVAGLRDDVRMTPLSTARAIAASSDFKTGDILMSTRDPGDGWVESGGIYLRNAYPALASHLETRFRAWDLTVEATPPSHPWGGIAYGNGRFVAVGGSGNNYTTVAGVSITGIGWTITQLPVQTYWASITFGNGVFVAVAGGASQSTRVSAASADGVTWTQGQLPTTTQWRTVKFAGGRFFAFPQNTGVNWATSVDGITWTSITPPSSTTVFFNVVHGNGVYVAFAATTSTTNYATSTNGTTWTARTLPTGMAGVTAAIFDRGEFFVMTPSGVIRSARSPDGITWETSNTFGPSTRSGTAGSQLIRLDDVLIYDTMSSAVSYVLDEDATWASSPSRPGQGHNPSATDGVALVTINTNNNVPSQASRLSPYGYDPATQFFTPNITTQRLIRAYYRT